VKDVSQTTRERGPRKPDRRVQRTRETLREALMALIVERGYDNITILDITERANVARTTFYLHFKDKEDLLFNSMKDVYEALIAQSTGQNGEQSSRRPVNSPVEATDFEHVAQYAPFYKIMLSEHGSASFLTRVRDFLAEINSERRVAPLVTEENQDEAPVELIGYMLAGLQIGAYYWWLKRDLQPSAPEMSRIVRQFADKGLLGTLRVRKN
jgi:AcrR family transcriptional regulator